MDFIDAAVTKGLAKKVMDELDLDAMAKKLSPVVQKQMMDGILDGFRQTEWSEIVSDLLYDDRKVVKDLILKSMGIPIAKKKKKNAG